MDMGVMDKFVFGDNKRYLDDCCYHSRILLHVTNNSGSICGGVRTRDTSAQARALGVLGSGGGSQGVHDGLVIRDGDGFVIGRANDRRAGTS